MGTVGVTASRPTAMALSPLLVRQARRVRQQTPRLPEASGDRTGIELTADATDLLRLLVVGESTAAGVGVTDLRDALPRQLAVALAARRHCNVAWSMSARTGATASFHSGVGFGSNHRAGHRRGHGRGQRRLEVHVETGLAYPH